MSCSGISAEGQSERVYVIPIVISIVLLLLVLTNCISGNNRINIAILGIVLMVIPVNNS